MQYWDLLRAQLGPVVISLRHQHDGGVLWW